MIFTRREKKYGCGLRVKMALSLCRYEEEQWKYQVRQTDGKVYENGKLVGERDLDRTKK
jgi:hypothetical protein